MKNGCPTINITQECMRFWTLQIFHTKIYDLLLKVQSVHAETSGSCVKKLKKCVAHKAIITNAAYLKLNASLANM